MNLIRAAAFVALALGACNLSNPGVDAPVGKLLYPIALTLSDPGAADGAPYLYVVNSNFDLRYNGGSVQSYDLGKLEQTLYDNGCLEDLDLPAPPLDAGRDAAALDAGADADPDSDAGLTDGDVPDAELLDGELPEAGLADAGVDARVEPVRLDGGAVRDDTHAARPLLCDGRGVNDARTQACCMTSREQLDPLRVSEVSIDSYAEAITMSPDGAHIYVPMRAQSRLLYLDVDEAGRLSCGEEKGRCKRGPKIGIEGEIDELTFPAQPTRVLAGSFADLNITDRSERYFVATAHSRGQVSLFGLRSSGLPKLLYTIATGTTGAASLRLDDGFMLLSSSAAAAVPRVGARMDIPANEEREQAGVYLYSSQPIAVSGLTFSSDIRDMQPDERDRVAGTPRRYYALLRGSGTYVTQSVGFLELDQSTGDGAYARAVDAVRVGVGMTKLLQADLGGRHLLFVSCYNDGEIHVIDADRRQTVTVIRDVLGPADMQIDGARGLLYVTDYRASVLRVVDLRALVANAGGVPRVVATLGAPYLPGTK